MRFFLSRLVMIYGLAFLTAGMSCENKAEKLREVQENNFHLNKPGEPKPADCDPNDPEKPCPDAPEKK